MGQQPGGLLGGLDLETLVGDQPVEDGELDVDDPLDVLLGETVEDQYIVDAVEELRPEVLLEFRLDQGFHALGLRGRHVLDHPRGDVGGHDDHGVAKVHRAALAVGEPALVKQLQEHVEDVGVGLLDLVEQQHRVGAPPHRLGELASLVVAHVARRGADHSRYRVFLHVLRHVDADHRPLVVEEEVGERPRDLGLADARRSQKEEGADRPVGVLETGARAPHRRCDRADGFVLADHPFADALFHVEELVLLALEQTRHRDAGPAGDRARNVLLGHLLGEDDAVLVLVGLEPVGGLLELLFEAHEVAVTQLCRPFEIAVALGAVGRLAGFFDLLLELLEP